MLLVAITCRLIMSHLIIVRGWKWPFCAPLRCRSDYYISPQLYSYRPSLPKAMKRSNHRRGYHRGQMPHLPLSAQLPLDRYQRQASRNGDVNSQSKKQLTFICFKILDRHSYEDIQVIKVLRVVDGECLRPHQPLCGPTAPQFGLFRSLARRQILDGPL